jgi:hypothetical protein
LNYSSLLPNWLLNFFYVDELSTYIVTDRVGYTSLNGSSNEEYRFLGCGVVWLLWEPTFPSVLQFLATANVIFSSPILLTLMMDVVISSETAVLAGAARRRIAEVDKYSP